MKLKILITLFLVYSSLSYSQMSFPRNTIWENQAVTGRRFRVEDIPIDSINRTFFVYKKEDEENLEDMQDLLASKWGHGELKLISNDEFKSLKAEKNDIIFKYDFTYFVKSWVDQTGAPVGQDINVVDFTLCARYFNTDTSYLKIGILELAAEESIIVDVCSGKKTNEQILDEIDDHGVFYNWDLSLLSTFVGLCSRRVEMKSEFTVLGDNSDLANVKKSKLYISDAVNIDLLRLQNKDIRVDREEEIKKAYSYDCEIVSANDLDNLAIENSEGYVLYYIRVGRGKRFMIIDLKTGNILFTMFGKVNEYNLKMKDIKTIRKAIEKA